MMTLPIMTDNTTNDKPGISNGVKLSKHTVFYDLPAPPGRQAGYPGLGEVDGIAYNTRTQGVLGINKEVMDFIGRVTSPQAVPLIGTTSRSVIPTSAKDNGGSASGGKVGIQNAPRGLDSPVRGNDKVHKEFIGRITNKSPLIRGDLGVCYTPRPFGTPLSRGEYSNEEQSCLNTLKDSGIIVDRETDEDKVLEDWFEEIRFRPRALHATILTTLKCNFACTYCFEESVKDAKTMNDRTADEVIEFLKHKAVEKGSPRIRLMFYGGEPLMNPGAIIRIASALKQWSAERGTKFSFGMITNGSLVRKDLMEQLAKLGLTSIRITLDGDKEVHDKRRPFLDGRGTFDTIVRNITEILDASSTVIPAKAGIQDIPGGLDSRLHGNDTKRKVAIELGANFDRDNIAGLHRLLDYLEQKGLNKRIARVLFAPVVSRLAGDEALTVEPVGCHKLSGELAEEGIKLEKELIQRGYNTPSSVKVSACPMTMDDSMLVIDPSGGLYKCEAFAGREQFCIGHVREPRFNHRYAEFLALKPWKECLDCPYVPMCGGGCRYIAQLKHSDYTKRACDKEYYEKIFPQLLKIDYERGVL